LKKFFTVLVGSFLYSGFFPFAPATFASLCWLAVFIFVPFGKWLANPVSLLITLPMAFYCSHKMEKYYGEDASVIVIDEFVGMQITFLFLKPGLITGLIGLLLFRIFDILKPMPINASQKLMGGAGVVVDDLIAGVYSRFILWLLIRFTDLL
jgi:phosphatidylglycerophosphatase A